jgi:hypothetical protein
MVKIAVLGEFIAQHQECARRPGPKEMALKALILAQQVKIEAEVESEGMSGCVPDRGVAAEFRQKFTT